jgi:hypothetical protein
MEIVEDGKMVECSRAGMCREELKRRGDKLQCPHGTPHKYNGLNHGGSCVEVHKDGITGVGSICGLHECIEVMDKPTLADPDSVPVPEFEAPKAPSLTYKVLQEYTPLDIALAVNTCIGQGWGPQGGVAMVRVKEKGTYLTLYSQAMVKGE